MHEITIGDDPQASAQEVAGLIRSDVKQGAAQPPGPHVVYADGPVSKVKSPAECNADGTGACATLSRATAPYVDASHVGVAETTTPSGAKVQHVFLATAAKPGEAPISLDANGKPLAPVPASRILDPSVPRGMPAPSASLYQSATYAPIWPPGEPDLSHVHAPAAARAAEGNAYSGDVRAHTPVTPEGAAVATAAQVAARAVPPPADHVARPVSELYPGHPLLTGVGKAEEWIGRQPPFQATAGMVRAWYDALGHVAAGLVPPGASLPGDPKLTAREAEAAKQIRGFLELLFQADAGAPGAAEKLERVKKAIVSVPGAAGDAIRTVVGEADAMLPGVVPAPVRAALVQAPPALDEVPAVAALPPPPPPTPRRAPGLTWLRLPGWSNDREPTNLPLDVALSVALSLPDALGEWAVGCPGDAYRRPEPPRQIDAHMGAVAGSAPAAPSSPTASATPASISLAPNLGAGLATASGSLAPTTAPIAASAAPTAPATPSPFTAPFETGTTGDASGGIVGGNWWDAPAGGLVVGGEDVPPLVDVEEPAVPPLVDVAAPVDLFAPPVVDEEIVEVPAAPPVAEGVEVVETPRPWWETVVQDVEAPFRWHWGRRRPAAEVVEEPAGRPRRSWWERWFGRTPARARFGVPANVGGHPANAIDPRTGQTYGREAANAHAFGVPANVGGHPANAIDPRTGQTYGREAANAREPHMAGVGDWWTLPGGDRVMTSRALTAAIRAYRNDPIARAQLLSGGTLYGLTLGEIRAALSGREDASPMVGLLGLAPGPASPAPILVPPPRPRRAILSTLPHHVPLKYYAPGAATCSTGTCGAGLRR